MNDAAITVRFCDPFVPIREREQHASRLFALLAETRGAVAEARRVPAPTIAGTKGGGFENGAVRAVFSSAAYKRVLEFIARFLGSRVVEVEAEANGRKIKIKCGTIEEFPVIMNQLEQFFERAPGADG